MPQDFRGNQVRVHQIIASGSAVGSGSSGHRIVIYGYGADGVPANQGNINSSLFSTNGIGTDVFLFVSGAIGSLNGPTKGVSCFGGDVYVSGNLQLAGGLTFASGSAVEFGITDYAATTNTTPTVVGQHALNGYNYSAFPIFLRGILAVSNPAATVSVKLYNVSSGVYVDIAGISQQTLFASSTTPAFFESVNLVSASGFSTSSRHIYELHASTSNGAYTAYAGGWHFAVTGAGVQGPIGQTGPGGGADPGASFVVVGLTSSLGNERALTAGPGIAITDYGANNNITISASLIAGPNITINQVGNSYAITGSASGGGSGSINAYPDTALPRLGWNSYSKLFIVPSKTSNESDSYNDKAIRLTFQDGIQRTHTGSITNLFISTSYTGQNGLDTGGTIDSVGGNTWYYLYMVPSGSNTNTSSLNVIASAQTPTGSAQWGPSGYTNFRYIGALFYKTSDTVTGPSVGSDSNPDAGLQPFFQTDSKTFTYLANYRLYYETDTLSTSSVDVTAPSGSGNYGLPTTISKIFGNVTMLISSSTGGSDDTVLRHRIYPQLAYASGFNPYVDLNFGGAVSTFQTPVEFPVGYVTEGHSYNITYRSSIYGNTPTAYTNFVSFGWTGYEDSYLDAAYINVTSFTASLGAGSTGADIDASFLVVGLTSSLNNERALAAGTGISFSDGGANSSFTVGLNVIAGPNITIATGSGGTLVISASNTNNTTTGSTTTTTATPATMLSYALPVDSLYDLDFTVAARQNTFANYGRWKRNIVVGRSGSAPAFIHASSSYAAISDVATTASWGVGFDASGNNIRLWVTGSTTTTVSWSFQLVPTIV